MRRTLPTALVCFLICLIGGCDPQTGEKPTVPMPGILAPAETTTSQTPQGLGGLKQVEPAPLTAIKKADDYWTQEEVESWVRQDLKLAQVTLHPEAEHGFSGTAVGFNGRTYTLTIQQIPGGIKCWFRDNVGGSGDMAFGKMAVPTTAAAP